MADYSSSSAYRPYADMSATNGTGGMYDELKNPLDSLRANLPSSGLRSAAYPATDLSTVDLDYSEHVDTAQAAQELGKFAALRLLSTLVASPFSIAQTLLQVQYLPLAVRSTSEQRREEAEIGGEEAESVPDPDDPEYYEYLRARHSGSRNAAAGAAARAGQRARVAVDHDGYVVAGGAAAGARPGYQLAALSSGKLSVLRQLVSQPTEGVLSVFKGSLTHWTYTMLHLLLQPTLEGVLNELLGFYDSSAVYMDEAAPSALTLVSSHVLVGWLLSPLELVRTRLQIQSASPVHRKYQGMVGGLRTVFREEGGALGLYFSSYHWVPAVVKHALDAVFRNMGGFFVDRVWQVDVYERPGAYAVAGLVWKTLAALVMLPVDTARARLMAQPRYREISKQEGNKKAGFREFRTCVPLAPVPYGGLADCLWRMVREEGESLEQMRARRERALRAAREGDEERARMIGSVGRYGLRALYPGITLQLAANVAIFGLGFIATDDMAEAF
ncbi:hypothetical protein GGI15_002714 [Coemansia interrupta]|uniref:Mitochondrial carrier protein n=1 Tax=Coemansia interrupta TaxID=1126814 RepID=A0A9W8LKN7_9FUNG|nr:hypothetical protein GGI15_002714 [Coemansia interrupta]